MTQPAQASRGSRGMRVYRWPPQPPHTLEVNGVTSIIEHGIPKPFLVGWAAKQAAECAVDNEKAWKAIQEADGDQAAVDYIKGARYRSTSKKAKRGTIVHAAVEAYLAGKPMSKADLEEYLAEERVPKPMWRGAAGMVAAAMEFLFDQEPEVLHSESTVYSREHGYAGTADLIVKMRVGKSRKHAIVDFKTSPRIYDETSLQLCAYSRADFVGLNDGTEIPLPDDIRDGVAVCLKASGKYEPAAFALTDDLFDVFLGARTVALGNEVVAGARRPRL